MEKLLITGFDPFGGGSINPAWEAVSRLPDSIGSFQIYPLMIPTVFGKAFETILRAADKIKPSVILSVGQAAGRAAITPEMIAINLRHASIADNSGFVPQDQPVTADGPAAYFSTVPVRKMANAIADAGIPASVSYSAGTFVCNDVMYSALHHFRDSGVRCGFIHVPQLPQQAVEGRPSMPLDSMIQGLSAAISAL